MTGSGHDDPPGAGAGLPKRGPLLRSNSSVRKALPGGLPGRGDAEFSKWEAGVFETVSRVEQDREHMEDKLQELRRALPRMVQIALLEWSHRAEAAAERLRVACKGVLEISRHHHQRLIEQATQWEGWQAQVQSSISAMAAMAAEQAQAEIAYTAAQIGARFASQVRKQAMEMLRAERTSVALRLQQARATLEAARDEYDKCLEIGAAQRDKVRAAADALSRAKGAHKLLLEFRDSVFELSESYSAWGEMKEPLTRASMRLAAMNPEVKDLLDPDEPSGAGRPGSGSGLSPQPRSPPPRSPSVRDSVTTAHAVGDEYQKLERHLRSLQLEMARIADTISAIAPRLEEQAIALGQAGHGEAQQWLDMLPLGQVIKEVQSAPGAQRHISFDSMGLRKSCEDVVGLLNESLKRIRLRITHLNINLARAEAMEGTAEAVRMAIDRRRRAAEADLDVLQAQVEGEGREEGEVQLEERQAADKERERRARASDANSEWEGLCTDIEVRYSDISKELVESESGSLYLRELLDQRWAELKEASAEYQAIREMFWARVHELTTGRRAVARTASSSSLGKRVAQAVSRDVEGRGGRRGGVAIGRRDSAAADEARSLSSQPSTSGLGPLSFSTPDSLRRPEDTALDRATVVIQAAVRGWRDRRQVASRIRAVLAIQKAWRARVVRERYLKEKYAALLQSKAVKVQAAWRGAVARRRARERWRAVVTLQRHARGFLARIRYDKLRSALGLGSSYFQDSPSLAGPTARDPLSYIDPLHASIDAGDASIGVSDAFIDADNAGNKSIGVGNAGNASSAVGSVADQQGLGLASPGAPHPASRPSVDSAKGRLGSQEPSGPTAALLSTMRETLPSSAAQHASTATVNADPAAVSTTASPTTAVTITKPAHPRAPAVRPLDLPSTNPSVDELRDSLASLNALSAGAPSHSRLSLRVESSMGQTSDWDSSIDPEAEPSPRHAEGLAASRARLSPDVRSQVRLDLRAVLARQHEENNRAKKGSTGVGAGGGGGGAGGGGATATAAGPIPRKGASFIASGAQGGVASGTAGAMPRKGASGRGLAAAGDVGAGGRGQGGAAVQRVPSQKARMDAAGAGTGAGVAVQRVPSQKGPRGVAGGAGATLAKSPSQKGKGADGKGADGGSLLLSKSPSQKGKGVDGGSLLLSKSPSQKGAAGVGQEGQRGGGEGRARTPTRGVGGGTGGVGQGGVGGGAGGVGGASEAAKRQLLRQHSYTAKGLAGERDEGLPGISTPPDAPSLLKQPSLRSDGAGPALVATRSLTRRKDGASSSAGVNPTANGVGGSATAAASGRGEVVRVPSRGTMAGVLIPDNDVARVRAVMARCIAGTSATVVEGAGAKPGFQAPGSKPKPLSPQPVLLQVSRDLSRLSFKAPGAKLSSFIRVVDITEVEDLPMKAARHPTPSDRSQASGGAADELPHSLVVRAKGAKEHRLGFPSEEDKRAWVEAVVVLLANRGFLTSLRAVLDQE